MSGINPISLFTTVAASASAPIAPAESSSEPLPICDPAGGRKSGGKSKIETAKEAIIYIMDNDKDCRKINKSVQAEKIARIALDVGAKPEVIGAIIAQETNFGTTADDLNKGNGIGPMQVTRITIQDMFERPEAFDPDISKIVGNAKGCKYKTFAEALKAKFKNNKVNLGKFGNKFFEFYKKNKTYFDKGYYLETVNKNNKNHKGKTAVKYSQIPKSIRTTYENSLMNYDMGLYLGCYTYKMKSRGKSESVGLKFYHGPNNKDVEKYVRAVNDTITRVRRKYPELKNLNIKS